MEQSSYEHRIDTQQEQIASQQSQLSAAMNEVQQLRQVIERLNGQYQNGEATWMQQMQTAQEDTAELLNHLANLQSQAQNLTEQNAQKQGYIDKLEQNADFETKGKGKAREESESGREFEEEFEDSDDDEEDFFNLKDGGTDDEMLGDRRHTNANVRPIQAASSFRFRVSELLP